MPLWGAFGPRWQVARSSLAGVTKSHRYQGNDIRVIKNVFVYTQPFSQLVTAGIIPGYTAFMHFFAWSLPNY